MIKKKKQTIDLMPTKTKTLLLKISKEHEIRFGNNHNYEIIKIEKSFHCKVLLLNWFMSSIINWHLWPLLHDMQSTTVFHLQQIKKALNSWLHEVVTGYRTKFNLAASVSVPLFVLRLQHESPETSETADIYMLMASFLLM